MDTVDAAVRSRMMAGIRGKDTKIELVIRGALHKRGLRYRLHNRKLPGRPDMTFAGRRVAIFINGCFWHGHDCPLFRLPRSNTVIWDKKISSNRARDARSLQALHDLGWRTAVVWECAMRKRPPEDVNILANALEAWIRAGGGNLELRGPH